MRALLIGVVAALLCSTYAQNECEQEFEDSPISFIPPEEGFEPAKPCCLPQKLQGGIWLTTIIKSNRPKEEESDFSKPRPRPRKPVVVHAFANYAVDYGKGRLAVNEAGFTSNKYKFNVTVIQAADKKAMYIVDWQTSKCFVRPFSKLQQCISANATLLAQPSFGITGTSEGLKTNVYGLHYSTPEGCGRALSVVTAGKCAPFSIAAEFRSRERSVYSSMTYHDQKTSISNPNVFNPPAFCSKASSDVFDVEMLPAAIKHFAQM